MLRPLNATETEAWLAGRASWPGAVETEHGVEVPNDYSDPCLECGEPGVIDGLDATAHWVNAGSHTIAAWTCGLACADKLEARRVDGQLPV